MQSTKQQDVGAGVNTQVDPEVTLVDGSSAPIDGQVVFERGQSLGRYVVIEQLGEGGMGIVLAAYDTTLDRKVALKLLHNRASADPDNHARLLREAQALAKLSHPAVVSVYDVGEIHGQVFIAMEYIDGPNLRQWVHLGRRSPREIIRAFIDAARGLQVAHDAGIVHRDFKPDNVLIGSDGRARVTDFGLALEANVAVPPPASDGLSASSRSGRLTETGTVMGTPAYMPIEQHVGHLTDHRSDQFSFCVSMYEALYRVRPFSGNTANEYCLSIGRGVVPPPPADVSVPRRVHKAIVKGLSAKPEDRFPTMRALVRAITPPARNRRTWVVGGLAGVVLGATAVGLPAPSLRPCSSFEERIEAVYGRDDKRQILAAFTQTGIPFAQAAFDATTNALDDFARRWTEAAQDACLASERGEQSDRMLDLRMHCLDKARSRLAATVSVLRNADDKVLHNAQALASGQAELSLCRDLEALERTSVLPKNAEEAAEASELYEVLARIDTLRAGGHKEDAKALYAEHRTRLDATTYPPIEGLSLLIRGRLYGTDNDADQALAQFEEAYLLALAHGLDGLAAECASSMSFYYSEFKTDFEQAEHYIDVSLALAKSSGSLRIQASASGNLMMLRIRQARFDEAVEAAQRELELAENPEVRNDLMLAQAYLSRARAISLRDGPKASLPQLAETAEFIQRRLGSVHPTLVQTHSKIASVYTELGEYEEAYRHHTTALEQAREIYGAESLDVTYEEANIAMALGHLGREEEALELFASVDARFTDQLGADHPVRAAILNNEASIHIDRDALDLAIEKMQEALRIVRLSSPGPSDSIALLASNIAAVHILQGNAADAKPLAELSLEQALAVFGEASMYTAVSYSVLGQVARLEGDFATAQAHLERAVEIGHESKVKDANFDFELGRALVEDPNATAEQRDRGLRLARSAEKVFADHEDLESDHEEVLEWIETHSTGFSPG